MSVWQDHRGRQIDAVADLERVERTTRSNGGSRAGRIVLTPPRDREIAFAAAGRRSARVRFLRKAILVGVVGVIAAMIAVWIFNPFATRFGSLNFSALSIDGTKVAIARPRLSGFRSDGQPYSLTAERALQDIKQPTRVELEKLTGEIGMSGGEPTHVIADWGVYDSVNEHMRLEKNIKIGNGRFDIWLQSAEIDFKTGVYQSAEPVEVHIGTDTTIRGDRAEARDNGKELVFEGRVRTRIVPQAASAADGAKGSNP